MNNQQRPQWLTKPWHLQLHDHDDGHGVFTLATYPSEAIFVLRQIHTANTPICRCWTDESAGYVHCVCGIARHGHGHGHGVFI
jgi:hypothetical protein